MPLDYLGSIEADGERILAALAAAPEAVIPWSDQWTVAGCAQHVAGAHNVVSQVVAGRPTTDFGVVAGLRPPALDDPELPAWVAASTAALLHELRTTEPTEPCWTWSPTANTVAFWHRRMAHETLVHRWDIELGAGLDPAPVAPDLAADGVDEYLDVFLPLSRQLRSAPGGRETVHIHCTDADGEWLVSFPATGELDLRREHAKGDVAFRGPAEALLLFVWGRLDAATAGVDVLGDPTTAARWRDLAPPM